MANKKIIVTIDVKGKEAKKQVDEVSKSTEYLSSKVTLLTKAEQDQIIAEEKSAIQKKRLIQTLKQQAAAEMNVAAASIKSKTNAGLNNAIIAESARLASDASYGFTAIANNLGQLVSLFSASANAAGGLRSAIGALFTIQSLFLIGIQLLITYGDDLYNFFMGSSKAAEAYKKSLQDLEETVQGQRRELLGYIEVLRDTNTSESVRLNALRELEEASPNIIKAYKDQKLSLEELTLEVEEYIKQQRLRGELDAIISANQEVFAEREKVIRVQRQLDAAQEAGDLETLKKLYMENTSFFDKYLDISKESYEASGGGLFMRLFGSDADINFAELFRSQSQDTIDEYDAAVQRIIEIEKQITDRPDDAKNGGRKRFAAFKKGLFDQSKVEERFRQQSIDLQLKTEEEKINMQRQFSKDELQIALDLFTKREEERLRVFKEKNKGNQAAILDAENQFNQSMIEAKAEANDVLFQIDAAYDTKLRQLTRKRRADDQQDDTKARAERQKVLDKMLEDEAQFIADVNKITGFEGIARKTSEIDAVREQMNVEKIRFDNRIANLEREKQLAEELGLSTLGIEAKINAERQRYAQDNVKLKIKERDALINITNQLGEAIMANLDEGSNAQKAVSIALATINTYEAATAALGMKPYTPANIAQAAAVVLAGLAQVRNIVNTKLPRERGARGSVNVEAPDFNVVGASPESQLAQTVAGQQAKPIKAFVVGKEITSQQELDRNIQTTAGIGG